MIFRGILLAFPNTVLTAKIVVNGWVVFLIYFFCIFHKSESSSIMTSAIFPPKSRIWILNDSDFYGSNPGTLLLDVLLPSISQLCHDFTERYTRTLALQSLHDCEISHHDIVHSRFCRQNIKFKFEFFWYVKGLSKVKVAFECLVVDEQSRKNSVILENMSTKLNSMFEETMEFVWKNSEHKFDSIVDQVRYLYNFSRQIIFKFRNWCIQTKLIFKTSLDIFDVASQLDTPSTPSPHSFFISELIQKCLNIPYNRKSKYNLLLVLFGRVGAHKLLEMEPLFLENLLMAMKWVVVVSGRFWESSGTPWSARRQRSCWRHFWILTSLN